MLARVNLRPFASLRAGKRKKGTRLFFHPGLPAGANFCRVPQNHSGHKRRAYGAGLRGGERE